MQGWLRTRSLLNIYIYIYMCVCIELLELGLYMSNCEFLICGERRDHKLSITSIRSQREDAVLKDLSE